jgi:hypothetical protein
MYVSAQTRGTRRVPLVTAAHQKSGEPGQYQTSTSIQLAIFLLTEWIKQMASMLSLYAEATLIPEHLSGAKNQVLGCIPYSTIYLFHRQGYPKQSDADEHNDVNTATDIKTPWFLSFTKIKNQ